MIVIAGRLSLLDFVFKPVSCLAGDSRLRQTFSLRIHLVERQSLSSICHSTIISYLRSLAASLSTSASRPISGPIVFWLDRNKPVTGRDCQEDDTFCIPKDTGSDVGKSGSNHRRLWVVGGEGTGSVKPFFGRRERLLCLGNRHTVACSYDFGFCEGALVLPALMSA